MRTARKRDCQRRDVGEHVGGVREQRKALADNAPYDFCYQKASC